MWMAPVSKKEMLEKEEMIRSSAPAGWKEKLVIITYGTLSCRETAWEKLHKTNISTDSMAFSIFGGH